MSMVNSNYLLILSGRSILSVHSFLSWIVSHPFSLWFLPVKLVYSLSLSLSLPFSIRKAGCYGEQTEYQLCLHMDWPGAETTRGLPYCWYLTGLIRKNMKSSDLVILGLNSESEPSEKYIRPVLSFKVNQFWKTMRRSREIYIVLESMLEELKGNEN